MKKRKKHDPKSTWKEVLPELLYDGILLLLCAGILAGSMGESRGPRMLAGYSAFLVLTGSMEDTFPQGSLVITKQTDAEDLKVGDDITYLVDATTSVTHRIVGIEENYQDSEERAFRTQGTMNAVPDQTPVPAVHVVGKVIFHSVILGAAAAFLQENWPLVLFFIVVLTIFVKVIKKILREDVTETPSGARKHRRGDENETE